MTRLALTLESTTTDLVRLFAPAKSDSELKALISEVIKEGRRVFGGGFTIWLDETNMSKNFRNRIYFYVP